jgi:hypothetical protein
MISNDVRKATLIRQQTKDLAAFTVGLAWR